MLSLKDVFIKSKFEESDERSFYIYTSSYFFAFISVSPLKPISFVHPSMIRIMVRHIRKSFLIQLSVIKGTRIRSRICMFAYVNGLQIKM